MLMCPCIYYTSSNSNSHPEQHRLRGGCATVRRSQPIIVVFCIPMTTRPFYDANCTPCLTVKRPIDGHDCCEHPSPVPRYDPKLARRSRTAGWVSPLRHHGTVRRRCAGPRLQFSVLRNCGPGVRPSAPPQHSRLQLVFVDAYGQFKASTGGGGCRTTAILSGASVPERSGWTLLDPNVVVWVTDGGNFVLDRSFGDLRW